MTQIYFHLGSATAPVPCRFARQSRVKITCKHPEKSRELAGRTVSPGYCALMCKAWDGPLRTPALIQQISGVTVNGAPVPLGETPRPTRAQIKSWLKAEYSLLRQGPVPLPVFDERMSKCTPCQHRVVDRVDDAGYCNKCGCGARDRARLHTKLHMPKATCPLEEWGEAKGEGRAALARLGGTVDQVRAQIRQAIKSIVKRHSKSSNQPKGKI